MTKEEAIRFAVCLKNNWTIDFNDMEDFCNMAIEALSADAVQGDDAEVRNDKTYINEPYMQQSCNDDGRMTREEAIRHIRDVIAENNSIKPNFTIFEQEKEALYMAIEALSANAIQGEKMMGEKTGEYIFQIAQDSDGVYVYIKQGELIRCKDCKHSEGVKCSMYYAYGFKEEDYCSYGERKEEHE